AAMLHLWASRSMTLLRIYVYRFSLCVAFGLLVVAGHFGGNLTHGSKYLVENAPTFIREFLEEPTESPTVSANAKDQFYLEKIQPLLAERCYSCHGADKQKGGYRLDIPERAL